jgi:DNA repair exonuclease SbcCD nuclease subunit
MKRRSFLQKASLGSLGVGLMPQFRGSGVDSPEKGKLTNTCVTAEGTRVNYYSEQIAAPLKITFIADTHLHLDDERGDFYRKYSKRMAGAYNETRHFQTGALTNPEETFEQVLQNAVESGSDLIALGGDIFSFPSEAAIEWASNKLEKTGIPYLYVAGNHDWHYEGMEGTLEHLREKWIEKRLLPLYQNKNPLMAAYDVKGIRFLAIDNSTYQISNDQLTFFREQKQHDIPLVLIFHIPLYAPGRPVGYGCGHPEWGAETDTNHELERRPKWPATGHSETTFQFHREVFSAPNLLGIFAGHIHRYSMEMIKGKPQFVTNDNASGAFLDIHFSPLSVKDQKLIF